MQHNDLHSATFPASIQLIYIMNIHQLRTFQLPPLQLLTRKPPKTMKPTFNILIQLQHIKYNAKGVDN